MAVFVELVWSTLPVSLCSTISKYHLYRFTGRETFSRPRSLPKWRITTIITNNFGSAQQIYCFHILYIKAIARSWTAPWPSAAKCYVCLFHSPFDSFVHCLFCWVDLFGELFDVQQSAQKGGSERVESERAYGECDCGGGRKTFL